MTKRKYVAAPGRQVPIDPSLAAAPGGALLILREGSDPLEADPNDSRVIKMILAGDIVPQAPAATEKKA